LRARVIKLPQRNNLKLAGFGLGYLTEVAVDNVGFIERC